MDHNTTSTSLSELGVTPAAQTSGRQIPPSTKEKGHCLSTVTYAPVSVGVPFDDLLPMLDPINRVSRRLENRRHLPSWHTRPAVQLHAPRCAPGRHSAPRSAVEPCSARNHVGKWHIDDLLGSPSLDSVLGHHLWHFSRHGNLENLIPGTYLFGFTNLTSFTPVLGAVEKSLHLVYSPF